MRALLAALGAALVSCCAAPALAAKPSSLEASSGSLTASIEAPFRLDLEVRRGARLVGSTVVGPAPVGGLSYRTAAGWVHATSEIDLHREGRALVSSVATTVPGKRFAIRVVPAGDGVMAVRVTAPAEAQATSIAFGARAGERFFGFGERSNGVDQRGREVDNYVADGPNIEKDRPLTTAFVPPWAQRDRDDATYYPIPWLLSSRGYGVLIDNDEESKFRLALDRADTWSAQVEGSVLRARFFAGPTPAQALARFTKATGRQPPPPAPWAFGPWFQTGQPNVIPLAEEARITRTLRGADAPVSAAETQMHYLPCGAQRGNEAYLRERNRFFHSQGLAHLAYFNPALCESYQPVFARAAASGVLQRDTPGRPFTYPAFVGGGGSAGFTREPLAQFDFTARGTEAFYAGLVREAVAAGHDGWMEDFGENSPPQALSADGTPGAEIHNRYPTLYHCTVRRIARRLARPVVRFQRSGWRGSARCADVVWGGDPTTVWGFDGLSSAVRQALSIGMSGISRWGSDIGGYNTFDAQTRLTRELLKRWIQFGAVSGVMRTKRSGIALPPYERPQVFDPEILPVWRRYTKLHTQLHPYLLAADRLYRRTGMPLMRHLALTWPRDRGALAQEDQFMFGPSFLAAPVTAPGVTSRQVYAPAGRWIDFWRSVAFVERSGAFALRRAKVLRGGRSHMLPAPLEQLPLLVRAGAVVAMLPADVDTLAPFGRSRGLVHLDQRRGRMTLLAFPRGRTGSTFNDGERLLSAEGRAGWSLRVAGARRRVYSLQASLATLSRRFTPCRVALDGRALARRSWSYRRATGILSARFIARRGTLAVTRCGSRR